jgi:uncharacterized membrane protein YccC
LNHRPYIRNLWQEKHYLLRVGTPHFALASSKEPERLELQAAPMASTVDSSSNKSSLLMLREKVKKLGRVPASWAAYAWSIGREDQRRAIHALKVGLALTLVSLLYILEPLFKGLGKNAMWAVMTVVVVLEFTAGNLASNR